MTYYAIGIDAPTGSVSANNWSIYNNTIYKSDNTLNNAMGIKVDSTANDTIIRNNFVSFPHTTNKTLIDDQSGNAV